MNMPVTIVAEKNGVFQFSSNIPEHLQPFVIKGASCQVAEGSFGYILLQQIQAQQFLIHYNRYCFSHNEQINFTSFEPLLEVVFNLEAPVCYQMDGLGNLAYLKSAYNIVYLPAYNQDIFFERNITY